jgi:hydroxyethylthiazole kinase-like sugar kinase family protein
MDTKQMGSQVMKYVADNAVEIGAGAIVIAGGVAIAKAGTSAVVTTGIVGGCMVASFVAFHAARGAISAALSAPAAAKAMYQSAKDRMNQPQGTHQPVQAAAG